MNDIALLFYIARQPEYASEYLVGKPTKPAYSISYW